MAYSGDDVHCQLVVRDDGIPVQPTRFFNTLPRYDRHPLLAGSANYRGDGGITKLALVICRSIYIWIWILLLDRRQIFYIPQSLFETLCCSESVHAL